VSKFIAILALILGAALALFGVQNQELVALHFLWFTAHALPVSLAILAAAVLGLLVGLLLALPGRLAAGHATRRLTRAAARRDAPASPAPALTSVSAPVSAAALGDAPPQHARLRGRG
jgi:putative membrane protein